MSTYTGGSITQRQGITPHRQWSGAQIQGSNVGKGSRQQIFLISGQGLALRAGCGGSLSVLRVVPELFDISD